MAEVWFYHLERQPLDAVLPELLQKTLARGWRALVHAGSQERVQALDAVLWTHSTDGFIPHGTAADGFSARQPIYLTDKAESPNAANVIFLVDGALPRLWTADQLAGAVRIVVLFDGNDSDVVKSAREDWELVKGQGHDVTYWQQSSAGRWEKKS